MINKRKGNSKSFKKGISGNPTTMFKKGDIRVSGEKSNRWSGGKAYSSIHAWVYKNKPRSMFCEKCGIIKDKLEASSINHTYEKDISKWRWLCRRCHIQEDKK